MALREQLVKEKEHVRQLKENTSHLKYELSIARDDKNEM
jgi:hypothetical protein